MNEDLIVVGFHVEDTEEFQSDFPPFRDKRETLHARQPIAQPAGQQLFGCHDSRQYKQDEERIEKYSGKRI